MSSTHDLFLNASFLLRSWHDRIPAFDECWTNPSLYPSKEALSRSLEAEIARLDDHSLDDAVRLLKYRELGRLALIESAEPNKIEDVLEEWSYIAGWFISRIFDETLASPTFLPCRSLSPVVLALGKLGADELNFSSDVDLIYLYDDTASDDPHALSLIHTFFSTITRRISAVLGYGFLFRVDLDLRPHGKQSPIAHSITSAEHYYARSGAGWERQALIRAYPVAGDAVMGNRFLDTLRPFIFRRHSDWSHLSEMRRMKAQIETGYTTSPSAGFHLKKGKGAIREIEFCVQALQILHGGTDPHLQSRQTFSAIRALQHAGHLKQPEALALLHAYAYFRHVENMIQIESDQHDHTIPSSVGAQTRLADRMNEPFDKMIKTLVHHSDIVHRFFCQLFDEDYERVQLREAVAANQRSATNLEEQIDSLAWFKREQTRRIMEAELDGSWPIDRVCHRLSVVAESILEEAYELTRAILIEQASSPIATRIVTDRLLVMVAMGKLGGREIDYGSDLDLLFIFDETSANDENERLAMQECVAKWAQRIISTLTLYTRYGRAYAIDTALRPSGKSGILVTSLSAFETYHQTSAAIWERQALLRARPIAGHPALQSRLASLIHHLCFDRDISISELKASMMTLRERIEKEKVRESETTFDIKNGVGGLLDIEFITQFVQLRYGQRFEGLRTTNTLKTLNALNAFELISPSDYRTLYDGYLFWRQLISLIRMQNGSESNTLNTTSDSYPNLLATLKQSHETLIARILATRQAVRDIFRRIVG